MTHIRPQCYMRYLAARLAIFAQSYCHHVSFLRNSRRSTRVIQFRPLRQKNCQIADFSTKLFIACYHTVGGWMRNQNPAKSCENTGPFNSNEPRSQKGCAGTTLHTHTYLFIHTSRYRVFPYKVAQLSRRLFDKTMHLISKII